MEKELNALTTSEFFSMLKNQKLYSLKEEVMDTLIEELNKEKDKSDKIGQYVLSQVLTFLIDVTEKEKILFSKGYTEFIWHKDLTRYITSVKPNAPTILDLEYYERTIPEINAADIIAAKDLNIFDRLIEDKDRGEFILDMIEEFNIKEYLVIDDDIDDITPYVQSKSIMKIDSLTGISSYQLSVLYRWIEDPTRYHRNY